MGKLIVRTGEEITSQDHALFFDAEFGCSGVMDRGKKLLLTVASANSIKIADGIVVIQGRPYVIYPNELVTLTVENGTQNMKRNDLVVAEFSKDSSSETFSFKVIKGTAVASNPVDPSISQQDTLTSGTRYQLPLYRIRLNGINIEGTDDLRTYIPSLHKTMQVISETDDYVEVEFNLR